MTSIFLLLFQIPQRYRFSSKSQRYVPTYSRLKCCFRYHKGTDFQANHNTFSTQTLKARVVLDTTKVQIFKQITTYMPQAPCMAQLFQIPQRYRFSSKSQPCLETLQIQSSCFRYHKGTDFQANHNTYRRIPRCKEVVLDTTKVQIFKQITTPYNRTPEREKLFQIPQRYRFSSKSQQLRRVHYH